MRRPGAVAEEDAARRAAEKKARRLRDLDYAAFRRRLGEFLLRRGFPYEYPSHHWRWWQELGSSASVRPELGSARSSGIAVLPLPCLVIGLLPRS